jgi:hypothetical protein
VRKQLLVILLSFFVALFGCGSDDDPYYGFYESNKGPSYKLFRHNLFGFEIDIPTAWTFGVAGQGPGAVIMIYSPEIDTSTFSSGYHTLSVGVMPIEGVSLERSYEAVLSGMKQAHASLDVTVEPYETSLGGQDALHFEYEWPSKTELIVVEDVRLVQKGQRVFSVNIRTIDLQDTLIDDIYGEILPTFRIL